MRTPETTAGMGKFDGLREYLEREKNDPTSDESMELVCDTLTVIDALDKATADLEAMRLASKQVLHKRDELWKAEVTRLRLALACVEGLINESHGVTGLHLNGDVALWGDLRTGGQFEEWLMDFDAALAGPEAEGREAKESK